MANIKSQKKRNRQNERARARNRAARSEIRTKIKVAEAAIVEGSDRAPAAVNAAVRSIDGAVSKGVLHRNSAARKKSRLMQKLNRMQTGEADAV